MYTAYQEITFLSRPVLVGTLRIFIPGLLLMLGLLFGYYNSELNHRISVLKTTDIDQLASSKQRLLKDLHTAISDLEILSEHRAFREVIKTNRLDAVQYLDQYFLTLSSHREIYDQVRYLDQTGLEVVRVNFNSGSPAIVPTQKLQNKGERYYFKESFALNKGQIFISPLDLNIENGKIETPFKPMIRLAVPVFDQQKLDSTLKCNFFSE